MQAGVIIPRMEARALWRLKDKCDIVDRPYRVAPCAVLPDATIVCDYWDAFCPLILHANPPAGEVTIVAGEQTKPGALSFVAGHYLHRWDLEDEAFERVPGRFACVVRFRPFNVTNFGSGSVVMSADGAEVHISVLFDAATAIVWGYHDERALCAVLYGVFLRLCAQSNVDPATQTEFGGAPLAPLKQAHDAASWVYRGSFTDTIDSVQQALLNKF